MLVSRARRLWSLSMRVIVEVYIGGLKRVGLPMVCKTYDIYLNSYVLGDLIIRNPAVWKCYCTGTR
jgi:hypothetical protein